MEAKKENDNVFRMLILSDLHYEKARINDFEPVISSFIKTLSSFLRENEEWNPQCLALVGDIAHSASETSEYDDIHALIDRIRTETGTSFQVVTVPGNHDKQFLVGYTEEEKLKLEGCAEKEKERIEKDAQTREAKKDLEAANDFLKSYADNSPGSCAKTGAYLTKYFGYYTRFASVYNTGKDWYPIPEVDIDESLKSICGYYLMEREKICLVALNTEWKYVPGNGGGHRSILTVGEKVVKQMESRMKLLKRDGYTVITLMHRSPYHLCWKDVYGSLEENSMFERVVSMSDLIICGHEHNAKSREPDTLMSRTLLYQNGIMFDRSPRNDGRYPYSASLIRMDIKTRLLKVVRIRFNTSNAMDYEWTASGDTIKTYAMDALVMPEPRQHTSRNELYREITLAAPVVKNMLEKKILPLFYPCSGRNDIPAHILCDVIELNNTTIGKMNEKIEYIKQNDADCEQSAHEHVILYKELYRESADVEKQMQEAIFQYKTIKDKIKSEEIGHKIVINLVFCNILI